MKFSLVAALAFLLLCPSAGDAQTIDEALARAREYTESLACGQPPAADSEYLSVRLEATTQLAKLETEYRTLACDSSAGTQSIDCLRNHERLHDQRMLLSRLQKDLDTANARRVDCLTKLMVANKQQHDAWCQAHRQVYDELKGLIPASSVSAVLSAVINPGSALPVLLGGSAETVTIAKSMRNIRLDMISMACTNAP